MPLDPWATEPEPDDTPPGEFLLEIEDMQHSGAYDWASDTLEGIYETVEESGRVTRGQRLAVENIRDARRR